MKKTKTIKIIIMRNLLLLLLTIIPASVLISQEIGLQAQLHYATFYSPDDGPYIETYISIFGSSVIFKKNENNNLQASVSVTLLFKKDDELYDFRKFNLLSPELPHDSLQRPNFIDVQRIPLPAGAYSFEIILKDKNTEAEPYKLSTGLEIIYDQKKINMSGIQLIENYNPTETINILSKNGYDLVPYISNFYPENSDELVFYIEIYNVDQVLPDNEDFLIRYYIESYETSKMMHQYSSFKREKSKDVAILLGKFNIEELPSGNFNLVVEVRNRKNELLKDKRLFFQRSNPEVLFAMDDLAAIDVQSSFAGTITNIDTLRDYIKCLYPISNISERRFADNVLKNPDREKMQQYFVNFWTGRNQIQPEQEWKKYKKHVDMVNRSFTTQIKKGYETDRGRIYLQYGTPNSIREEKHCGKYYPFEIWQFYELDGQMNRKFLFYNPDIVGEDFRLLHSNVKGEYLNDKWISALSSFEESFRQIVSSDLENDTEVRIDRNWGCDALEIWQNP